MCVKIGQPESDDDSMSDSEDLESAEKDDDPRSRSSLKRQRVQDELALAQLVQDLLPLRPEKWEALGLSDAALHALSDAKTIKSPAARARQARLIRSTLRAADWSLIRRRLELLHAGFTLESNPTEQSSEVQVWTDQLLIQGEPGLARYCEAYPRADRKRLRQLVRNALRVPEGKRVKARLQLERIVLVDVGDDTTKGEA